MISRFLAEFSMKLAQILRVTQDITFRSIPVVFLHPTRPYTPKSSKLSKFLIKIIDFGAYLPSGRLYSVWCLISTQTHQK